MDENNRKKAIQTSIKGVIYLVLVMIGIFGITSLVKMAGYTSSVEENEAREANKQWEEQKKVKEANSRLLLTHEENSNGEIAALPLGMYLKILDFENGVLKLELDNQSGYKMEYTEIWKIEVENGADYQELGVIYGQAGKEAASEKELKSTILLDLTKVVLNCDLNSLGELKPGHYRIWMEDLESEFTLKEAEE